MTLNRTLERLFRSVRAEAARNPAFAAELEAALSQFRPRRPGRMLRASEQAQPRAAEPNPPIAAPALIAPSAPIPALNPIAVFRRLGAAGLRRELEPFAVEALRALIAEHNLDPAGEATEEGLGALVERIVAAAQRRVERDQKLFAY